MTTLDTPAPETIPGAIQASFERLTGQTRMPPLYRQIGNSAVALDAYLGCEQALADGVLSTADVETVKLVVSAHNRCAFCIKTHRAKGEAAGVSVSDIDAIFNGTTVSDQRLEAVRAATVQLLGGEELGSIARQNLESAGLDQAAMVEIAFAMATISFTNWFNHINHTPA